MKNLIINRVTPQAKNIAVNNKFGNSGIKQQQGTSVTKYDTLPIDGRTTWNFFEGAAARNFPFSNCGSDGNKLGVGNTLVVERAYFTVMRLVNGILQVVNTGSLVNLPVQLTPIAFSELNLTIANSTVLKNFPIMSTIPDNNYSALNELDSVYSFDTNIVIPPLLEYVGTLRSQKYTPITEQEYFLRLTLEGSGSIIAPRTTF